MAKSVALERRVSFYPDPKYKTLLEQLSVKSGDSKSSIVNKALRELLDKMPPREQQQLLERAKK